MKLLRLGIMLVGLVIFVVCIVLLLNITAPNPTHRRYSSQSPTPGDGPSAEVALSNDLGVPRNSVTGQRQCFCKGTGDPPPNCTSCAVKYAALTASYRIPDFLTGGMIGESKNRQYMDEDDRDLLSQIGDYSLVGIKLPRPLWIYVRVDTQVDPVYEQLASATGGDVVYYFTFPGYIDPVDQTARGGLVATGGVVVVAGVWELWTRRQKRSKTIRVKVSGTQDRMDQVISVQPDPHHDLRPQPHDAGVGGGSGARTEPMPSNPITQTDEALKRAEEAAKQTRKKLD
ncbi:MAG: hypothetical protein ACYDBJ_19785 [Aggregatilineales bacterium]